jgi:hypothetical protein
MPSFASSSRKLQKDQPGGSGVGGGEAEAEEGAGVGEGDRRVEREYLHHRLGLVREEITLRPGRGAVDQVCVTRDFVVRQEVREGGNGEAAAAAGASASGLGQEQQGKCTYVIWCEDLEGEALDSIPVPLLEEVAAAVKHWAERGTVASAEPAEPVAAAAEGAGHGQVVTAKGGVPAEQMHMVDAPAGGEGEGEGEGQEGGSGAGLSGESVDLPPGDDNDLLI